MSSMPRRWVFSSIHLLLFAAGPAMAQVEVKRISEYEFDSGDAANGNSVAAVQSPDGRFVAFSTVANNLAAGVGDDDGKEDVVVLDRQTGLFDYVTLEVAPGDPSNQAAWATDISDDGRWVLIFSRSRNLIPGLTFPSSSTDQAYLFDRSSRSFQLVSHAPGSPTVAADRDAFPIALSADGRYSLLYSTASNLATGGAGNFRRQVYLFDRTTGDLRLVSHAAGAPATLGNASSTAVGLSADGRFALLRSSATNLVAGLTDAFGEDVFVYDRVAGTTELISRSAANPLATTGGNPHGLTPDGRFVLLDCGNVAMVAGATDGNGATTDVFVFDRQSGSAELVSRSAAAPATSGDQVSGGIAMSADGRYVYFTSFAGNLLPSLTDTNGELDVFFLDRQTGATTLVSHTAGNPAQTGNGSSVSRISPESLSADGRFLVYGSLATDLEAGVTDGNEIEDRYRYDRQSNSSTLVSRLGASLSTGSGELEGGIVDDSGAIVFAGTDRHDPAAGGSEPVFQLFRFAGGAVDLLTATPFAGKAALGASVGALGADGRYVAWSGYLFDSLTGGSELVGHAAGTPEIPANGLVTGAGVTPNGRHVLLETQATDLAAGIGDTNSRSDVYLYDRDLGSASLLSHRAGVPSQTSDLATSSGGWLSADGNLAVLSSRSTDLVAGQSGPTLVNLFVYDRMAGAAELISHHHASPTETTESTALLMDVSPDGRYLVFQSDSLSLIPGFVDHNDFLDDEVGIIPHPDLYFYDRVTRQATLISHQPGLPAEGATLVPEFHAALAAGNSSVFYTLANSFGGSQPKTYRWDRATNTNQLVQAGVPLAPCDDHGMLVDLSSDGRWLLLTTLCAYVAGDTNGEVDAYLLDRQMAQVQLISHLPGNPATAVGGAYGRDLSADARKVVYTQRLPSGAGTLYSYDRVTQERLLATPAYFDGDLPAEANFLEASEDGNTLLVRALDARLAPFDANRGLDLFLVTLTGQMFADGFESGNTAAWSLTVP